MGLKDSIIPRIPRQHYCSYGLIPLPSPFSFLSQDSPLPSPTGANSYMFPSDAGSHRSHPQKQTGHNILALSGMLSACSEVIKACLLLIRPVSWTTGACVCYPQLPRINQLSCTRTRRLFLQLCLMIYHLHSLSFTPAINIHLFWKKLILRFSKNALNWSKVTVKTFMLQKISISNKWCSFELSIHQRILKNKMYDGFY